MAQSSEEEEDDYLSMTFGEVTDNRTTTNKPVSSLARRRQAEATAHERGRQKSKRELEHERLLRLERGLRTNNLVVERDDGDHDRTNASSVAGSKGRNIMAKLGYTGGALGKRKLGADQAQAPGKDERLVEPIRVNIKTGKGGIGVGGDEDPGAIRAREALDREEERVKRLREGMGDYRERNIREGKEKRLEGQWWGAMRACRTLREQDQEREGKSGVGNGQQVDVCWRELVRQEQRQDKEKMRELERKEKFDRHKHGNEEDEQDEDDKVGMGSTVDDLLHAADEPDAEEDKDLDEFADKPVDYRLMKTVLFLRDKWWYCFWCKARYDDEDMDGCPGTTEDDHE